MRPEDKVLFLFKESTLLLRTIYSVKSSGLNFPRQLDDNLKQIYNTLEEHLNLKLNEITNNDGENKPHK